MCCVPMFVCPFATGHPTYHSLTSLSLLPACSSSPCCLRAPSFSYTHNNHAQQPHTQNTHTQTHKHRLLGLILRHCILFPLRLTLLLTSHLVFFIMFFTVKAVMPNSPAKLRVEQRLIKFLAGMYVASFTGVIKFHGPQPMPGKGVWVCLWV